MSQILKFGAGSPIPPGTYVQSLTGDLGGTVPADISGNINVITNVAANNSGATVEITGNPGTSTLTLNVTDVNNNTLIGKSSGNATVSGSDNIGLGHNTLNGLTSGQYNIAIGSLAQSAGAVTGNFNIAVGGNCQTLITSAARNVAVGVSAHSDLTTGVYNVAVGDNAMNGIKTGFYNVAVGKDAGNNAISGGETSNIYINSRGSNGVSNSLRIGEATGVGPQELSTAFISGIAGVVVANQLAVVIDSVTNQLGTIAVPSGGSITLTGDTGGAVSPDGLGNINVITDVAGNNSGSTVEITGNPGTSTLTLNVTDVNSNMMIGNLAGNSGISGTGNVGVGYKVLSNLSTPSFNIGLGWQAQSAQVVTGPGNVAIGANAQQHLSTGQYNTAIGHEVQSQAAVVGNFNLGLGYQSQSLLASGFENIGIGTQTQFSGSITGNNNIAVGFGAQSTLTSGVNNIGIGQASLAVLTNGNSNIAIGVNSGTTITSATNNIAIGGTSLFAITSGSYNIGIGYLSGNQYISSESDNIILGASGGILGESAVMRLGNDGTVVGTAATTTTYIQGIAGVSVSNQLNVVIDSTTGKLGTNAPHVITGYVVANATPFVVGANDYYITVDTSTIAITIQLPNAPTTYRSFIIKDSAGNAFSKNVTVTTVGGAVLLDGATTYVMNTNYASIQLLYDGFGYQIY